MNTQAISHEPDLSEFRTIRQLTAEHPNLVKESALRWQLRSRHENGLDQHVAKIGKELVIHVPGYVRWLLSKPRSAGAA